MFSPKQFLLSFVASKGPTLEERWQSVDLVRARIFFLVIIRFTPNFFMFLKVYYSNPILPLTLCKKSVSSDLSRSSLKNLLEND